ncbi:MAG TPA: AMP-binding protein [Polyangiaceae bacterium]
MVDELRYLAGFLRGGLAPLLRQAFGEPTLADVLARWARARPGALALQVGEHQLDAAELARSSRGAAEFLARQGARSGDVVALVGRNSVAYVALLLGAAQSGVTLALVHPELSGEPLRHALAAAHAGRIVCEQALAASIASSSELPQAAFDAEARQPFSWSGAGPAFDPARKTRDMALVYTSGTTGLPKACRLPHTRVLAAACLFAAPLYGFRPGDKLLCALPLHHGSPLMLGLGACLVTRTPLVLERRFSASDFMAGARRSGATAMLYVGDVGRMLLGTARGPDDRAHSLRVAVGNGMSAEVWLELQRRFGIEHVREFYAATESPVGIFNLSGRVGSVGNLPRAWMFGLKLARIDLDTGELLRDARGRLQECAPDEAGELLVRARKSGLGVYHGYVDPEHTEARLVRSAFADGVDAFRTGDLLRRDRDGYYYFLERLGDSFRFKGENVSVTQVERELSRIPGVVEALVTGVVVPGYDGRAGLAVLVCEPGFELERLQALVERLPRSALPRFVRLVSELPRTSSLKLKRRAWAEPGIDPERAAGELWVLLDGRHRPLDAATFRDLAAGRLRL